MASIYLDDDSYNRLSARANQLGIPVNQLVTDILLTVDLERNFALPQSFQSLYQDLIKRVDEFVKNATNHTEFLLRDVAGWNDTINQSSYSDNKTVTPNAKRASLGRTFYSNVIAGNVTDVIVSTRVDKKRNTVKKLDKNGVVIYKVDKKI